MTMKRKLSVIACLMAFVSPSCRNHEDPASPSPAPVHRTTAVAERDSHPADRANSHGPSHGSGHPTVAAQQASGSARNGGHPASEPHAEHAPAGEDSRGARHHDRPSPTSHGHHHRRETGPPAQHVQPPASQSHAHAEAPVEAAQVADARFDLKAALAELAGVSSGEIYQRRIAPIAKSDQSSSCTSCHFHGVELANFIGNDEAATFAALRDDGLLDLKNPDESKLLRFIRRHPAQEDPLEAKVRRAEMVAFTAWIRAAVRNEELLSAKSGDLVVGPTLPVEVVRHVRRDRVVDSFVENVWTEIGRCINCHSPERNQRLIARHGDAVSWIVPRDPAATLAKAVEQGIIDTDAAADSLILTKPLNQVEHGGGPKFLPGSRTDKNFRRFLTDYAATVNDRYKTKDELPPPTREVAWLTRQHLRITGLPANLDKKLLRVDLFQWTGKAWSTTRWGTAEGPVNGSKGMWQNLVALVAPRDSKRAAAVRQHDRLLPAGRYLAKIYVDRRDETKADRDYELTDAEFFGQVEFAGRWPPGYQPPKIIRAPVEPSGGR